MAKSSIPAQDGTPICEGYQVYVVDGPHCGATGTVTLIGADHKRCSVYNDSSRIGSWVEYGKNLYVTSPRPREKARIPGLSDLTVQVPAIEDAELAAALDRLDRMDAEDQAIFAQWVKENSECTCGSTSEHGGDHGYDCPIYQHWTQFQPQKGKQ